MHVADLATGDARLLPPPDGIIGRFALGGPLAQFVNIGADGDRALLLDIDPASATFHQIVATVPLSKLSNGPQAGQPTTGREARAGAVTPDGRWSFVAHGGDGAISVIDTQAKRVTATIDTPTPMRGGGYLFAVQPGMRIADLMTR
ncbi:MAG: hypothetical protein U0531_19470 [Dehalococcoidia bacterium]